MSEAAAVSLEAPVPRDTYRSDGFLARRPILTEVEAGAAKRHLQDFITAHGDNAKFADWCYFKTYLLLPWVVEIARHPNILNLATALIGPDLLLWNAFIPVKKPNSAGMFGWHQDATYWPLAPIDKVVSIWLALAPVSLRNGGMRMIPGSHKRGQLDHEKTVDPASMLRRGQHVAAPIDETNAVEIQLSAGEASIHHPFTLHGSGANGSSDWRYGIAFNIVSADVEPHPDSPESALYLSGADRNVGFVRETAPTTALSPEAHAAFSAAESLAASRYAQ